MNTKFKTKHYSGYTLIELLFIIVVIGIIASLGLTSYLQRTNNIKVEKTALQMQQLLQAGNAYYQANSAWPSRATCSTPTPDDFSPYIPVNTQISPWGQCYTYGVGATQQFQIVLGNVPNTPAMTIASLLPNATTQCSGSVCNIIANIGAQLGLDIKVIRTVSGLNDSSLINSNDSGNSEVFSCPMGWTAVTQTVLAGINPRNTDDLEEFICTVGIFGGQGSLMISNLGVNAPVCFPVGLGKYTCPAYTTSQAQRPDPSKFCAGFYTDNLGPANITYFSYCMPPGQSQQAEQPVRY